MDSLQNPTPQVSWVLLAGVSVPAVVTQRPDGTFIATSPDWRVAAQGDTATGALRELGLELDRRVERALEESRRMAATRPH